MSPSLCASPSKRRPGFTLVELLLVLSMVLVLVSVAIPVLGRIQRKAAITEAVADLRLLESEILAYLTENRQLPADLAAVGRGSFLDPWGNPYHYLPFPHSTEGRGNSGRPQAPDGARKDRFLHPVNSDFDLYSRGPDGATNVPFTAGESQDDVVRAGNGQFLGLAADF